MRGLTELKPCTPDGADWGEPSIPRVCAGPTIAKCILSTIDMGDEDVVVYVIDREPDVDNVGVMGWPEGGEVHDANQTGEVWYLVPVTCVCLGTLEEVVVGSP